MRYWENGIWNKEIIQDNPPGRGFFGSLVQWYSSHSLFCNGYTGLGWKDPKCVVLFLCHNCSRACLDVKDSKAEEKRHFFQKGIAIKLSFCHQSLAIISNPLLRFPMCQILSVLPIYLFILSFNPLSPALSPLHGFLRWALLLFSVFMRG